MLKTIAAWGLLVSVLAFLWFNNQRLTEQLAEQKLLLGAALVKLDTMDKALGEVAAKRAEIQIQQRETERVIMATAPSFEFIASDVFLAYDGVRRAEASATTVAVRELLYLPPGAGLHDGDERPGVPSSTGSRAQGRARVPGRRRSRTASA